MASWPPEVSPLPKVTPLSTPPPAETETQPGVSRKPAVWGTSVWVASCGRPAPLSPCHCSRAAQPPGGPVSHSICHRWPCPKLGHSPWGQDHFRGASRRASPCILGQEVESPWGGPGGMLKKTGPQPHPAPHGGEGRGPGAQPCGTGRGATTGRGEGDSAPTLGDPPAGPACPYLRNPGCQCSLALPAGRAEIWGHNAAHTGGLAKATHVVWAPFIQRLRHPWAGGRPPLECWPMKLSRARPCRTTQGWRKTLQMVPCSQQAPT